MIIYDNSDNLINVTGLKDLSTGAFLNGATVEATVNDASGSPVAGETWPLSMPYVPGSNGDYQATLKDTLAVATGDELTALVTADAGAGLHHEWIINISVRPDQQ